MDHPASGDGAPGRPLLDAARIATRVGELAGEIAASHSGVEDTAPLLLVCVLKGSFMFTADLARGLARHGVPVTIEFIAVRSYAGATSTGAVKLVRDVSTSLRGRDVLIVEDVVDTGLTTAFLVAHCRSHGPRRVRLVTLLDKPGRRRCPVVIDFRGFEIGDGFVVGYGLDLDERWRELPEVRVIPG